MTSSAGSAEFSATLEEWQALLACRHADVVLRGRVDRGKRARGRSHPPRGGAVHADRPGRGRGARGAAERRHARPDRLSVGGPHAAHRRRRLRDAGALEWPRLHLSPLRGGPVHPVRPGARRRRPVHGDRCLARPALGDLSPLRAVRPPYARSRGHPQHRAALERAGDHGGGARPSGPRHPPVWTDQRGDHGAGPGRSAAGARGPAGLAGRAGHRGEARLRPVHRLPAGDPTVPGRRQRDARAARHDGGRLRGRAGAVLVVLDVRTCSTPTGSAASLT